MIFDFRLNVFYTVAKRLNFTKAAEELYITQPAVTKHIRELETHFKISLFERSGNRKIFLTPAGEVLLGYVEQLHAIYKDLEFDMNGLIKQHGGELKIGASNTVGQYVIPAALAQFHDRFKNVKVTLITGNTIQIEEALLSKEIDLGIIEGIHRNPQISYHEFIKDEIVLVSGTGHGRLRKGSIRPEELKNYPLLLREHGSGSLDVIANALKAHHIRLSDLQIEMQLGSAESIKNYLASSECIAFLSVHAILNELKTGACRIVDIKGVSIERYFHFIHLQGQVPPLADLFMRLARSSVS